MNTRSLLLLCALGCAPGAGLLAEIEIVSSGQDTARSEQAALTPAQLDQLLSPIALYPDPLIALILPASTFPTDIVMAARYLHAGGDPQAVETQPWDDSVKALARYPEVVKWMDENLAWTRQLGEVFTRQPAALLTSTQRLRAAARAAGNLTTTPEQTVVVERELIRIVPARPEIIYVPVYDPVHVYRPRVVNVIHTGPILRFGNAYRTGFWLSYHCDWIYNTVWVVSRPHRLEVWNSHPRWVCPPPSAPYVQIVRRPARPAAQAASPAAPAQAAAQAVAASPVAATPPTIKGRPAPHTPDGVIARPANRPLPSAGQLTSRPARRSDAVRPATIVTPSPGAATTPSPDSPVGPGTPPVNAAPQPPPAGVSARPSALAPTSSRPTLSLHSPRRQQIAPTAPTVSETASTVRPSARPSVLRGADSTPLRPSAAPTGGMRTGTRRDAPAPTETPRGRNSAPIAPPGTDPESDPSAPRSRR